MAASVPGDMETRLLAIFGSEEEIAEAQEALAAEKEAEDDSA